jgi:predicted dehydrogenase
MSTDVIQWGIVGCGDVCEVKSGPGFQKAEGSALAAVMRRDRALADDYARRHGVPRVHATADALIGDPDVHAVYIATPPSSHLDLALRVAAAGKPCLVEKPMAMNHAECARMVEVFRERGLPLWVAFYRRALPRFLEVRALLRSGAIGRPTSAHVLVKEPLADQHKRKDWRFDPVVGGGLLLDLGSHCVDLLDFFLGPLTEVHGLSTNTSGAYATTDLTSMAGRFADGAVATGLWNFDADEKADSIEIVGTEGRVLTPVFSDIDVVITRQGRTEVLPIRNPPHVHQPLIQTIVDELRGRGRCESSGESGARSAWVLDRCGPGFTR